MPVEAIGLVGDDDDGRFLLAQADVHAVDRAQIAVTRASATQFTDAYASRRTGRRTHLYYPGAAALLTPDHFDLTQTRARIAHFGLPGVHRRMDAPWGRDANGWVTVLKRARDAGLVTNLELVSVDPHRIRALVRPCLPYLDLLIVNDFEIGALAAEQTLSAGGTDIAACIRSARQILAAGPQQVVVVHFPVGAIAAIRNGGVIYRPSVRVPQTAIVGANGAGDAFAAGFLYAWHERWGVPDALGLGHAAAAASLRGISTTDMVEAWRSCLDLAAAWGEREPLFSGETVS
jgi:sugar/nucleoside kinase (ribokinase family)